jgi:hypothetical protein
MNYSASLGKYLEPDPLASLYLRHRLNMPDLGGLLRVNPLRLTWRISRPYLYARNNSVQYVDPWGLYACIYHIRSHTMDCTPSDPSHPSFHSDNWVSGNNAPVPGHGTCADCRDNPARTDVPYHGTIPPGGYGVGGRTTPGGGRRPLTPQPGTSTGGRGPFQTHGCPDNTNCSEGCPAATTNEDRDRFNELMDLEQNNTLTVVDD